MTYPGLPPLLVTVCDYHLTQSISQLDGFVPQDFDCEGSDLQYYFTTLNFEYRC